MKRRLSFFVPLFLVVSFQMAMAAEEVGHPQKLAIKSTASSSSGKDAALFKEAAVRRALYRQSHDEKDLLGAISLYNQIVREYPRSDLADDALFHIATLRHDPLGDDVRAKKALDALLDRYPRGDVVPEAKKLMKSLGDTGVQVSDVGPGAQTTKGGGAKTASDRFKEPPAAARGERATLVQFQKELSEDAARVTLVLDREVAYTTEFTERGKRTGEPAHLSIHLSHVGKADDLAKDLRISSPYVVKATVKKILLAGGLEVRFDLGRGTNYEVIPQGKLIHVRFFRTGSKTMPGTVAAETKGPATKPTKKAGREELRIVIDPGHGGEDTGAIGSGKTKEKDVVLKIAKKLAEGLRRELSVKVFLTRTDDRTLTLEQRNSFARKKNADLFLSIHANAAPSKKLSGIQTYYLNNATDKAAAKLATRENANAGKSLSEVEHILSTMLQNYSAEESRILAEDVHRAIIARLSKNYPGVHDLKVRSALFYVLVGAKCPGVLIETSFISNPREERRLKNPDYQGHLAKAILDGVKRYQNASEKRMDGL